MKQVYIICTILLSILMVYRVLTFIRFRRNLKAKSIDLIKLRYYRRFSFANLFVSFCFLACMYFTYSSRKTEEDWYAHLTFWIFLFFAQLTTLFTQSQDCIIINLKGFKRIYGGRLILWEKVEKMEISNCNSLNFKIVTRKRAYIFGFSERSDINNFLVRLKRFRPDIYDKYINNLSYA